MEIIHVKDWELFNYSISSPIYLLSRTIFSLSQNLFCNWEPLPRSPAVSYRETSSQVCFAPSISTCSLLQFSLSWLVPPEPCWDRGIVPVFRLWPPFPKVTTLWINKSDLHCTANSCSPYFSHMASWGGQYSGFILSERAIHWFIVATQSTWPWLSSLFVVS